MKSMFLPKQLRVPRFRWLLLPPSKHATLIWDTNFPTFSVYICEYIWKKKGSKLRISLLMPMKRVIFKTLFYLLKPHNIILFHSLPHFIYFPVLARWEDEIYDIRT